MVRVEYLLGQYSVIEFVCPYLSGRTLPARIRHDPASRTIQDNIIRSYELQDRLNCDGWLC
jgi:hypothetical protein